MRVVGAQLLSRVRRTLTERRLVRRGDLVLVAISGGPDSSALLDVLCRLRSELQLTLLAASVDHGLRAEARWEVARARALADARGVQFFALQVQVASGASVQAQARRARYAALLELARREGARRVAVGHTMDDQAETVLSRILRGAGLRGLGGIAARRADGVIRPLIDARRADVLSWNAHHDIDALVDPSNVDARFERVRLREQVLPLLRVENENLVQHLAALADDARAMTRISRAHAARLLARAGAADDPMTLQVAPLTQAPRAVRREALGLWLTRSGLPAPARAHLEGLEKALKGRGEVRLQGGVVAGVQGSHLRMRHVGRMKKGESASGNGHDH